VSDQWSHRDPKSVATRRNVTIRAIGAKCYAYVDVFCYLKRAFKHDTVRGRSVFAILNVGCSVRLDYTLPVNTFLRGNKSWIERSSRCRRNLSLS